MDDPNKHGQCDNKVDEVANGVWYKKTVQECEKIANGKWFLYWD